jgi:prepilin-type N-terminal cleavage/methylation domain-containing protein
MYFTCNSFRSDRLGQSRERKLSRRGQHAFTMVEVMVAVFIIAIASIALYGGFASGFMLVDSARQELRATQILTQKAEALKLCSWSSLTNCPISFKERYDPVASGTNGGGTIFVGTVSTNVAAPIPDTAAYKSNMCLATITLQWTNYNGRQSVAHSRTLKTLVARYGVQNYIWGTGP